MKKRYYYILAYFLVLISFPFIHILFFPRPDLRNFKLNSEVKDTLVRKNNFDLYMDKVLRRKIIIGDTYLITDSLNRTFQITPISAWNLKDLNFKKISNLSPNLIVQNGDIRKIENNNYAIGKINNDYYSQTCLVNKNSYFFDNDTFNVPQFWEIKYWIEILKDSIVNNLIIFNKKSENCLLITSSNLENFKEDINTIYQLINFK